MNGILKPVDYDQVFPDLAGVYLEDSWVLEVHAAADGLAFRLDAVITPEHPRYHEPRPNEQHCYLSGWLTLRSPELAEVRLSGRPAAVDANRERDFGKIDRLVGDADGVWEMDGDWGYARLASPSVTLILD